MIPGSSASGAAPGAEWPGWTEIDRCPICHRSEIVEFESLQGEDGAVQYQLCSNCGTVFQSPRMMEQELTEYYRAEYVLQHQWAQGVSEKELRVQFGRAQQLVQLLRRHRAGVEWHLDIGSSAGLLMESMREVYGCESVGIEPADVYREYASARGLRVYPSLEQLAAERPGGFDLVSMAHVLEHLPDPIAYLRDLREKWLTPNGTLLVEVPNLFGHLSLERPHLFCFHGATLKRTLANAGFKTARLRTHGAPRSRLIPLYLTAIAEPLVGDVAVRWPPSCAAGVRFGRRVGMFWYRLASRRANRWAWLSLPEMRSES